MIKRLWRHCDVIRGKPEPLKMFKQWNSRSIFRNFSIFFEVRTLNVLHFRTYYDERIRFFFLQKSCDLTKSFPGHIIMFQTKNVYSYKTLTLCEIWKLILEWVSRDDCLMGWQFVSFLTNSWKIRQIRVQKSFTFTEK